jgi:hypothetical protein
LEFHNIKTQFSFTSFSGSVFILLLLLPISLNASSSWMSTLTNDKTVLSRYKVTAEELDGMIYAYADSYMTKIVSATRDIISQTNHSQQRSDAMQLRVGSVNSIYDIASSSDPYTKLLDLLLVVTLQSYVWIDEDRAETLFGKNASILIHAMHQNRQDIWKLAAKVMKSEQLYILDWLIIDWRRQNPDINFVIFTRFSDVSASRGKSQVTDVQTGSGFLAPVNEAKKAIDETRLLAERSFFYAKRAPQLYAWQTESLTDNMLAKPEISQLLAGINRSTLAIERVSKVMENLPQLIREERQFISSELDKRESALSKLLTEFRQTVKVTEHLILTVDNLSGTGNVLLKEIQVTSDSLNTTLITFDKMMTHHFSVSPDGEKSSEESKPFDINEYTKALIEVDHAAVGLTKLVGASGNMVTSERLTNRIEQLNNAAKERVEHATEQSEKLMQTLFLYIVLTVIFIFMLLIGYHKLSFRQVSKAC